MTWLNGLGAHLVAHLSPSLRPGLPRHCLDPAAHLPHLASDLPPAKSNPDHLSGIRIRWPHRAIDHRARLRVPPPPRRPPQRPRDPCSPPPPCPPSVQGVAAGCSSRPSCSAAPGFVHAWSPRRSPPLPPRPVEAAPNPPTLGVGKRLVITTPFAPTDQGPRARSGQHSSSSHGRLAEFSSLKIAAYIASCELVAVFLPPRYLGRRPWSCLGVRARLSTPHAFSATYLAASTHPEHNRSHVRPAGGLRDTNTMLKPAYLSLNGHAALALALIILSPSHEERVIRPRREQHAYPSSHALIFAPS